MISKSRAKTTITIMSPEAKVIVKKIVARNAYALFEEIYDYEYMHFDYDKVDTGKYQFSWRFSTEPVEYTLTLLIVDCVATLELRNGSNTTPLIVQNLHQIKKGELKILVTMIQSHLTVLRDFYDILIEI